MPDPITALKRFDEDATPVPALPAEEVRRRGDRLRRRNRAALAGVAVVAVVAGSVGVSAVVDHDGPSHIQPAPAPTNPPTSAPQGNTLRPDGLGKLRLGMSVSEIEATGQATVRGTPGKFSCASLQLTGYPERAHDTDGYVSKSMGLEAIFARPGITTPEGIGPGSTLAEAKAAYPGGRQGQGHWLQSNGYLVVPLAHGREYEFGIEQVLDPNGSSGPEKTIGETLVTVSRSNCFG